MTTKIGVLVGSLSSTSINKKLAKALARYAPEGAEIVEIPIGDLPLYSPDFDSDYPEVARNFKAAIEDSDGILFVTPEYNRSIPGALKNAIDWASRPWGQNSLGKPAATIGASVGPISSAVGQQQLKDILLFSNASVMGQPEGYIHFTEGLIDDEGVAASEDTAAFLAGWMESYVDFVNKQNSIN